MSLHKHLRVHLTDNIIQYHGNQSPVARDKTLKDFKEKPDKKILIMSLKAGGLGLNITVASRVILMDLWFNSAIENQGKVDAFCRLPHISNDTIAIARIHRIGQTRPTTIVRIVVENSVDDRLMALQERKNKMIGKAMGGNAE